jgi:DNA recombination protein RmuC
MNAYLDSLNQALSDAERQARRTEHAKALRNHVRALAAREYAKALGASVEITVLFVPLESGLIAALEEDTELYNEALQKRVVITTASTLLALLRVCALQWQQAAINENAREIQVAGQELYARIVTFADHMEKVRKGLNGAVESFNKASASMESRLFPKARELKRLGAATQDDIGTAAPIELSAQPLSIENHVQENDSARRP